MQILIDETSSHSDIITLRGQKYPAISIERECIVKPSLAPEALRKDIFLENSNGYWRRLMHHFQFRGGFWSMLTFAKKYYQDESEGGDRDSFGIQLMFWIAFVLLNVRSFFLRIYLYFYPYEAFLDEVLIEKFSSNPKWKDGLLRCFEWHPVSIRCALSLVNDLIYVYSADARRPFTHICCLKNAAQRNVSALAWHPIRDDFLIVASENRILTWTLASNLKDFKVEVDKCLRVIRTRYSPITSIVFNKDGSQIFACTPRTSSLLVINLDLISLEVIQPIQLINTWFASPLVSLCLSPDNSRLLAHTTSNRIRIFENKQWSSKCWSSNLENMCSTACWSTLGGRFLLYASKYTSKVYALTFYDKATEGDVGGGPDKSTLILDTLEPHFDVHLGAEIQQLAWDENSTRLAISFNDNPGLVAIFKTSISPSLIIDPLYTIVSGFEDQTTRVLLLRYHNSYNDQGNCLLSIGWSTGKVSHVIVPSEVKQQQHKDNDQFADNSTVTSPIRSLTSFCSNYNRLNNQTLDGSFVDSPNKSGQNTMTNGGTPLPRKIPQIVSPRRTELFSPRLKFD